MNSPQELSTKLLMALHELPHSTSERKEPTMDWGFAHAAVGRRMAAVMVDLMRLLVVRSSGLGYRANRSRYEEFVELAKLHFDDLRNNIGALPTIGEAQQYQIAREAELVFLWLIRTFAVPPSGADTVTRPEVAAIRKAAQLTQDYYELHPETMNEIDETLRFAQALRLRADATGSPQDYFLQCRHVAQSEVVNRFHEDLLPGIMMDAEHKLALRYFAIDWWLLGQADADLCLHRSTGSIPY